MPELDQPLMVVVVLEVFAHAPQATGAGGVFSGKAGVTNIKKHCRGCSARHCIRESKRCFNAGR